MSPKSRTSRKDAKRFALAGMLNNKDKTKKILVLLIAALCFCIGNKAIAQIVDSGTSGDYTWTLTGTPGNYTLTISGSGKTGNAPWIGRSDIKTVVIQPGVTNIWGFLRCTGLTSVTIPNSVTRINSNAFKGCTGLTSVTIPNSVTEIGSDAFEGCTGLTSVTIPNSVTYIDMSAFEGCTSLTSVTIPNSVTYIGASAFKGCTSLTSVTIPNSVPSIGMSAFAGCKSLTSVTIPNSVKTIGYAAFSGCKSLTSVTIPNSVTSIEGSAFENCTGLTSVTIANSNVTIDPNAFKGVWPNALKKLNKTVAAKITETPDAPPVPIHLPKAFWKKSIGDHVTGYKDFKWGFNEPAEVSIMCEIISWNENKTKVYLHVIKRQCRYSSFGRWVSGDCSESISYGSKKIFNDSHFWMDNSDKKWTWE
jgi:hypothetical protein